MDVRSVEGREDHGIEVREGRGVVGTGLGRAREAGSGVNKWCTIENRGIGENSAKPTRTMRETKLTSLPSICSRDNVGSKFGYTWRRGNASGSR